MHDARQPALGHGKGEVMNEDQKDFLIEEFKSSWLQILAFDNRRGVFLRYYTAVVGAVILIVTNLVSKEQPQLFMCVVVTLILLMVYVSGDAIKKVLASEREANLTYRNKINWIREVFLKNTDDPDVKNYLAQGKEIGIRLGSDPDKPSGDGRTLPAIYQLINYQKGAVAFCIAAVWIFYLYFLIRT
jgi:hypothetical protein